MTKKVLLLRAFFLLAACSLPAHSAELTWNGGEANWTTGAATNWAGGAVWNNGDSALFNTGTGYVTLTNDIQAGIVTMAHNNYDFTGTSITLHLNGLVFSGGASALGIRGTMGVELTAANAISGGTVVMSSTGTMTASTTGAISGGAAYFSGNNTQLWATGTHSLTGGGQNFDGDYSSLTATGFEAVNGGEQSFSGKRTGLNANVARAVASGTQNFNHSYDDFEDDIESRMYVGAMNAVVGGVQNFNGVGSKLHIFSNASVAGGTQNFLGTQSQLKLAGGSITGGTQNFSGLATNLEMLGTGTIAGGTQVFSGALTAISLIALSGTNGITGGTQLFSGGASSLNANGINVVSGGLQVFSGSLSSFNANIAGAVTNGDRHFNGNNASFNVNATGAVTGGNTVLNGNSHMVVGAQQGTSGGSVVFETGTDGGSGRLELKGVSTTVGMVSSTGTAGTIVNTGSSAATLTVSFDTGTASFGGKFQDGTGSLAIVKNGSGTWIVTGTQQTHTGGTFLRGGIVQISKDKNLGSNPITFESGTLALSAQVSLNTLTFGTGGGTFDIHGFDSTIVSLSGTGAFNKKGTGELLIVGGSNAFGGDLKINEGTFRVLNGKSLVLGGASAPVTVSGSLVNDGRLDFGGNAQVSAAISGTGLLVKSGAGEATFANANSYTGGTLVTGGTLGLSNNNALGSGTLTMQGGGVRAEGAPVNISNAVAADGDFTLGRATNFSGTVTLLRDVTITSTNPDTSAPNTSNFGAITGNYHLTLAEGVNGTGAIVFGGSNSYTGGTTFAGGTVRVENQFALAAPGFLTFTGGTLQFSAANTQDYSSRIASFLPNQQIRLDTNGQDVTFASPLYSAGGSLTKLGSGTLTLTGSNGYSGGTFLEAGVLALGNDNAIGTGVLHINGGTIRASGAERTIANTAEWNGDFTLGRLTNFSGSISLLRDVTITSGNPDNVAPTTISTISGAISGSHRLTITKGDNAAAYIVLSGSNSFTGGVTVNGGTVSIGNDTNLGAPTGTLTLNDATLVNTGDVLGSRAVSTGGTFGAFFNNTGGYATFGAVSGTGGVTKGGAHILTLTGSNTYTGFTTVNQGMLKIENGSLDSPLINLAAGTTLNFSHSGSLSGEIIGSGTFMREGTGSTVFTGQSGSSVGIVINGGTLDVRSAGGVKGNVLNNGTLRYSFYTNTHSPGVVSGTGNLVVEGAILLLDHDNTFTGGTIINNHGTIGLDTNQGLGTGRVRINAGGFLSTQDGVTPVNEIVLAGGMYTILTSGTKTNLAVAHSDVGGTETYGRLAAVTSQSLTQFDTSFAATSSAHNDEIRLSDVYTVDGHSLITTPYAIELTIGGLHGDAFLGWLDSNGNWVNARLGNEGNNPAYAGEFNGSFADFQNLHGTDLTSYMGAWGVDVHDGVTAVWTVVNHSSDFSIVPEPNTWLLVSAGLTALVVFRRRRP